LTEMHLGIGSDGYVSKFVYPWDGLWRFMGTVWGQGLYSITQIGKFFVARTLPQWLLLPAHILFIFAVAAGVVFRLRNLSPIGRSGFMERVELIDVYFVVYLGMLAFYDQKQGPRFLLPLVPIVLIYSLEAVSSALDAVKLRHLTEKAIMGLLMLGLTYNIVLTAKLRNFDDEAIQRPQVREMMSWVRDHVRADEHFLAHKPRVITLFTARTGRFAPETAEEILARCEKSGVKWVILNKDEDGNLMANMLSLRVFGKAWENDEHVILEFLPGKAPSRRN
jgi:hypothetical protein